jgi:hypothetical protein
MRTILPGTILLALASLSAVPQQARPKAPVPPAEEQEKVLKLVRDVFKSDYARKTPEGMKALAQKLLTHSREEAKGGTERFVLLKEAQELAARAGDIALAMAAIGALARTFDVDAADLKVDTLETAGRAATSPAQVKAVAEAYLPLIDAAMAAEDYDAAKGLTAKALPLARRAQEAALVEKLQGLDKEIAALRAEQARLKPMMETLKDNPNDPDANLAAGSYFCFTRDQWERGLPHLARCTDPELSEAATAEISKPEAPEDQVKLARSWREAARKKSTRIKAGCEQRALLWYETALQGTKGLARIELQQEVDRFVKTLPAGEAPLPGLVFWVEPGRNPGVPFREIQHGLRGENAGVTPAPGGVPALLFSGKDQVVYPAAGPVGTLARNGAVFAWIKTDEPAQFGTVANRCENKFEGPEDFGLYVHAGHLQCYFNWEPPDRAPIGYSTAAVPAGKWFFGGYTWDESGLTFYADGKKDNTIPLARNTPQARGSKVVLGVSTPAGPSGMEYYQGLVGSVMIFGRTLSEAEVERLHALTQRRFR